MSAVPCTAWRGSNYVGQFALDWGFAARLFWVIHTPDRLTYGPLVAAFCRSPSYFEGLTIGVSSLAMPLLD